MYRLTAGRLIGLIGLIVMLAIPMAALAGDERLVDSKDYKDKDFHKGIITDYSDMVKGDEVEWLWVEKGVDLADYKISVEGIANKSDERSRSMVEDVEHTFKATFDDMDVKKPKGTLKASLGIYEAEPFNPGKAWIPFVGGHQMQAGIGVEMVLTDSGGKVVAKLRDFEREGARIEEAAQEVANHYSKFVARH